MSAGPVEAARDAAQASILRRFGEAFARSEKGAFTEKILDPMAKKLAAARVALEYAVMKTALEKGVPSPMVAAAAAKTTPQQQAMLVKEGQAAMERAYGSSPDVIVGAMAGKLVDVPMPKGFASNPEFDKLIDSSRNLVTAIVQENYTRRGVFDLGARSEYASLAGDRGSSAVSSTRAQLAGRLAFIESAIDASVSRGQMTTGAAEMLKERVEAFVFQPRPPQSLEYTAEFKSFYQGRGQEMRAEVMKEVRGVTQAKTIVEIAEKLDRTMKAFQQPERKIEALER